jgi:hypothetical protein
VKQLIVTEVGDGTVLDTVTLTDAGDIEYDTGAARDMLARRLGDGGAAAVEAFAKLDGWSNGYVKVAAAGNDQDAGRTPAVPNVLVEP